MSERMPAEVYPLAEFLYEEFKTRGWRTEDAVAHMGGFTAHEAAVDLLSLDLLMCVHKDKLLVGDRMFAKLAGALGVSEDCLRNLDAQWRQWPDRRSPFECPEDIFGPISRRSLIRAVP